MTSKPFDWDSFQETYQIQTPSAFMENCFLLDLNNKTINLSSCLATTLFTENSKSVYLFSLEDFSKLLPENGAKTFLENIDRLSKEKVSYASFQTEMTIDSRILPIFFLFVRIPEYPFILGFITICYEMMHSYKHHLSEIIEKLEKAQNINQLILEGSTDYIYHLDLLNNVCTFSPKSLDVLPLESPTFGNAMDTILSFIVPEDRHVFLESFTPFLTGTSDLHTAEYRVNTKHGDIIWISCHGKGLHDTEGRPVMIAGSLMDITEQKKTEQMVQDMLYSDRLTGLKNRYCYEKEMTKFMNDPQNKGCIICIDIRNFKLFNEIFGHTFGNKILKDFADMLQMYLSNNKGIYRLEGDEFLVHLSEWEQDKIIAALTPLQLSLTQSRIIEGHNIYFDVTIGIAVYPTDGTSPEELLQNADTALYRSARLTKEKITFFVNGNGLDLSKRYMLENELRKDIQNNFKHFRVVFQPIIHMEHGTPYWCAAEALLRYSNPDMPNVSQMELIETLEVSGLILPVGRWVLSQAVENCSLWHNTGTKTYIHVNFSAQQLSDAGLLEYIRTILKKHQLSPEYLICELTETSLINNFETAINLCKNLMQMKIGIALDDFGTGYSSFNYLRTLPISQIKIDKTFVKDLANDEYNKIIISCLHDLSQSMKIELCIEGVETKETLDILTDMGIEFIQGFYFERPMEADMIRREIIQHSPM